MDLLQNPFYVLAATPRDNRIRIMELAEERSLSHEAEECANARSELINPRKRLSAEVAWLPGIGPKRAGEILALLESSPSTLIAVNNMSSIARANMLAAAVRRLPAHDAEELAEWILCIASQFEDIEAETLQRIINEERIVSAFPEVSDLSLLESEVQGRRAHYRAAIKSALNLLPPRELVKAITVTVERATNNGAKQGPILVEDLVDSYEVEAQEFFEKEEGNIVKLVGQLGAAVDAGQSDTIMEQMVRELVQVVQNWDYVAQPIQLCAQSRGHDHDASHRVAGIVRELAVHLFNEHDKLDISQKLTELLQEVFAEIAGVAERSDEDAEALSEIAEQRKLRRLLDPITDLCAAALENVEKDRDLANREALKILEAAPQLIANLSASEAGAELIAQGKDQIALALMQCSIINANQTKDWKRSISLLEESLKYANDPDVKSRIQKNLDKAKRQGRLYKGLKPITDSPGLFTIYGIGTAIYGSTDHESDYGSYLTTYYFVFLAIPIFPICRYRVIENGQSYTFLGKAPLRKIDIWHLIVSLGIIAVMLANL